ncbi:g11640 [Coccomyxa viridis]|uniref:thioredoxin-dependent peroxiredoxin n=1 Tax=Coccomyxa viridis TaxID=1274662 RepID=A0ABP1G8E6_9CHLO
MTVKVGDDVTKSAIYAKKLQTHDGKSISLEELKGKIVVLFFYPKASTPGCTKEACKFRDEYSVFKDAGAEVLGISSDAPEANAQFAKAQRLPFPLLSDTGSEVRKALGVSGDLFGLLPGRQTFIFDKEGKVAMVFRSQLKAEQHIAEAQQVIKTLK